MKKNRVKKIIALFMAMSMLLSMCACGKSNQNETAPEVGYFVFESMEEDGDTYTKEVLELAGMDINEFYLVMEEDGTGYLAIPGEETEVFTWADGTMKIGEEEISYTLDGDTLTLADGSSNIVYTRSSEEAPAKPSDNSGEATETETETSVTDSTEPVSADLGDYHISILSAEQFEDSDDKDSIRIYYDFTNNSDEEESFFYACNTAAYQDDYELVSTYSYNDEAPEVGNYSLEILPGKTIRCVSEYNFKPEGGEIEFTITEGYDGESVTMTFDPTALSGRPAEDYTIEPCSSDELVEDCPSEGVYDEDYYISITKSEVIDAWYDDEKAIRIYFDFTNNSEEVTTFWRTASLKAMQDGIEIQQTLSKDSVTEEDNDLVDVQPGETITVAVCYLLHDTGSSVAIKVIDYWGDNDLGATFEVQ